MLIDQTDDVEAVGDDDGLGEMPADQRTVRRGQIYADDAHQVLQLRVLRFLGKFAQIVEARE